MPHAGKLLIVLIVLCSGCAAAKQDEAIIPAPALIQTSYCPAPAAPVLPRLNGNLPLDHPVNVAAAMERDDLCRQYLSALKDTINCYAAQVGPNI